MNNVHNIPQTYNTYIYTYICTYIYIIIHIFVYYKTKNYRDLHKNNKIKIYNYTLDVNYYVVARFIIIIYLFILFQWI